MALQIQTRRRIRLTDPEETPLPRPRRSPVLAVGLGAWLASVAVAWGVQAGTIPVARWLEAQNAPDRVSARPERIREREPLLEIPESPAPALAPAPVPLPESTANEPIAPPEDPPIALDEPPPETAPPPSDPEAPAWVPTPANTRTRGERRASEPKASAS